jgi:predicted RNA binding protein YcfA (HicA-like mRNA interferase family)
MKLPRDLSAQQLTIALRRLDYVVSRQTGSHIRLTTTLSGEHTHNNSGAQSLKVGTVVAILRDICEHFDLSRDELLTKLFD